MSFDFMQTRKLVGVVFKRGVRNSASFWTSGLKAAGGSLPNGIRAVHFHGCIVGSVCTLGVGAASYGVAYLLKMIKKPTKVSQILRNDSITESEAFPDDSTSLGLSTSSSQEITQCIKSRQIMDES